MKNQFLQKIMLAFIILFAWMAIPSEAIAQEVHEKVDEMPVPPGGMDGWIKHLTENLKYPQAARDAKIEGMVVLTFIVKEDGSVSDVEILRGIGSGCDEEGKRVVEISPKWTPGKIEGKAVNTRMRLPINFKLS
jgi:protein TonB